MIRRTAVTTLGLFLAFFALYALTAQRGLGWGDSGEFQHWVLNRAEVLCGQSFSNSHPLYVCLARLVAHSPYAVTLVSSFFGALAVVGLYLCTGRTPLTVVFGFVHMLWWMSCVAEVQTMSLSFTAFETALLLKYVASGRGRWLIALLFLNGLHLEVHNFALLALPTYAAVVLASLLKTEKRVPVFASALLALAVWALGASFWLYAIRMRGLGDVLVGGYGAQVGGLLPSDWKLAAFNFALAALSLFAPAAIFWWARKADAHWTVWTLLGVNFLFFVRYFVPDQATFVLPTVFFAFLAVARNEVRRDRAIALVAMQVVLPLIVCSLFSTMPVPVERRAQHKYRNEASYFALPWKCHDDSADRFAAELEGPWTGYPDCTGEGNAK